MCQLSPILPHLLPGPGLYFNRSKDRVPRGQLIYLSFPNHTSSLTMAALFPQFALPGSTSSFLVTPLFPRHTCVVALRQSMAFVTCLSHLTEDFGGSRHASVIFVFPASNTVEGLCEIMDQDGWMDGWISN